MRGVMGSYPQELPKCQIQSDKKRTTELHLVLRQAALHLRGATKANLATNVRLTAALTLSLPLLNQELGICLEVRRHTLSHCHQDCHNIHGRSPANTCSEAWKQAFHATRSNP